MEPRIDLCVQDLQAKLKADADTEITLPPKKADKNAKDAKAEEEEEEEEEGDEGPEVLGPDGTCAHMRACTCVLRTYHCIRVCVWVRTSVRVA